MLKTNLNQNRRRFVAHCALQGYEKLSPAQKSELLLGLATILPPPEARAARATAWAIKLTEKQQLKFIELVDAGAPPAIG